MSRILFSIAALVGLSFASIQDCNPASVFHIETLSFEPDPPVANENATLTVQFYNPGLEVSDGTAITSVNYNFIPFAPSTEPLCLNNPCPFLYGENTVVHTSPWSADVNGRLVTTLSWEDTSGNELLCIEITTNTFQKLIEYPSNGTRKYLRHGSV